MRRRGRSSGVLSLACLLLAGGCGGAEEAGPAPQDACWVLARVPGPEDLVVDAARLRLLVSSQDRRQDPWPPGAIWSVPLEPSEKPRELTLLGRRDECSFHPHGIDLVRSDDGAWLLYVLNHHDAGDTGPDRGCFDAATLRGAPRGRLSSVEVFEVTSGHLRFVQRLAAPTVLRNGNDLAALPNGDVWVSDPPPGRLAQLLDSVGLRHLSRVAAFRCGRRRDLRCRGAWRVPWVEANEHRVPIRFANGIAHRPGREGRPDTLYVASGAGGRLHPFTVTDRGFLRPRPTIGLPFNPDNLTWADEERTTLVAAGHPDLRRFLQHSNSPDIRSPSEVMAVRPADGWAARARLFHDAGGRVSAASVAACAGDDLVLGQVFEAAVLRCAAAQPCGPLEAPVP